MRLLRLTMLRYEWMRARAWAGAVTARRPFRVLGEAQLRAARRSDTAFVFGSGYSLHDISSAEWRHVEQHDVIGLNYFIRQQWVRVDYHVVGEMATGDDYDRKRWEPAVREYARLLAGNPRYSETIVGLQSGWPAFQSNRLVALELLPEHRRVFYYRRVGRGARLPPTRSLSEGLVHGAGSLVGCVNFAYALGWRRIVLAGVDLYDSRYFWLREDEDRESQLRTRGLTHEHTHPTAEALVAQMAVWAGRMRQERVELSVWNPRSLLASVLPVYDRS